MKSSLKITVCIIIAAVMIFFSGCSFLDFSSASELMRAPKLTGEDAELQKAFENAVGEGISLLSPLTGNFRSAYILYDCNDDDSKEAIVFYCADKTDRIVHMNLLRKFNGEWLSVADIIGSGSEVYNVEFLNIDSDKEKEIIVTWTVSDTKKDKTISIYNLSFGETSDISILPLATVSIVDYLLIDSDADGISELFYLYYDSTEEKTGSYFRVLKYDDKLEALIPVSELKLNSKIASLLSFKYDTNENDIEFFVDCMINENSYFTEIIIYEKENNSLTGIFSDINDEDINMTKRSVLNLSADINDDGLIEIPVELISEESYMINSENGETTPLTLTDWQRYSNNSMVSIKKYFVSTVYDFRICVNELRDFAFIVYDSNSGEIQFREKNAENDDNIIFTVKELSDAENSTEKNEKYKIIISERGKQMNISKSFVESIIE